MTPMTHPTADLFLVGFIAACSLVAGAFFLRFWKDTRDLLFLAFAMFFLIQGFLYLSVLHLPHPNEGSVWLFLLRLLSVVIVLGAILWKNTEKR